MSNRPDSTLGYERATQYLFSLKEDAFVEEVLASVPPMPAYYPRMKSLNSEGATSFRHVRQKYLLSPEEVQKHAAANDATLLDLRNPEAYGGAHIPGSVNIGGGQNLSLWAGWMIGVLQLLVLISETENDDNTVRFLLARRVGRHPWNAQGRNIDVDWGGPSTRTNRTAVRR